MKPKAVLILGPPGSGKTSVCKIIDRQKSNGINLKHLSLGEEMRLRVNSINPIITEHINNGFPVPDSLLVPLVKDIISFVYIFK